MDFRVLMAGIVGVLATMAMMIWAPASAGAVVTAVLTAGGMILAVLVPLLSKLERVEDKVEVVARVQSVQVQETVKLADKVEVIHKATNSMHDAVVAATAKANFAEGVAIGKAEEKADAKADAAP